MNPKKITQRIKFEYIYEYLNERICEKYAVNYRDDYNIMISIETIHSYYDEDSFIRTFIITTKTIALSNNSMHFIVWIFFYYNSKDGTLVEPIANWIEPAIDREDISSNRPLFLKRAMLNKKKCKIEDLNKAFQEHECKSN